MMKTNNLLKKPENNIIHHYNSSIYWIKNNTMPEQGIYISSKQKAPYLEVTGYLIPTLIEAGEYKLAKQYTDFLANMQRPNGSFAGPDGKEYLFDTGQALRGLACASQLWDEYKPCAAKTADYLISFIETDGRMPASYGKEIPEYVHVFILPALKESSHVLNDSKYEMYAQKSLSYYKKAPDILNISILTHFLAYIIDGFIDMGEVDFVRDTVKTIFSYQKKNGALSAYPNVNWVCSTGMAQFAIIAYKLKMNAIGNSLIAYLNTLQNSSGGFYGSYGKGALYFPQEEISWANKFYIDALHIKIQSFFDVNSNIFPVDISNEDVRLKEIFNNISNANHIKILDAGCGKGRFSAKIKAVYPEAEIHGVDISKKLLADAPDFLIKKHGSILSLPYNNETFDCVFCVEALEHTMRTEKAIEELCRVAKNYGIIIILDKNVKKLGTLEITDFEQWFDINNVTKILYRYCSNVQVKELSLDGQVGLFLCWIGTKGQKTLNDVQWHSAIVKNNTIEQLASTIQKNQFPIWCKPLLKFSRFGDSMLELGSGTGELSAILGLYGRIPYLLDYSTDSIEFEKALFQKLYIKGNFFNEDIVKGISFKNNSVDWVWSSGLLEHFSEDQILNILKDSLRVCKKGVMSLVPNANSLLYRVGKHKAEIDGTWPWGREEPKYTMKPYFEAAGLKNIKEYSVAPYHSLSFMSSSVKEVKTFYDSLSPEDLQGLNQGYLLFTYGEKP